MHTKALFVGAVAASCSLVAANADHPADGIIGLAQDANIGRRADSSYGANPTRTQPKWASTVAPEKLSSLHADMQALATSIKGNRLYSSMTAVLATAVPQTFKDAVKNNPSSVHAQYKTSKPEWYLSMPSDVRSFMDANRHAAKSIFTKDIGPIPTHSGSGGHGAGSSNGASGGSAAGSGKKASSEADSLRVAGAAVGALLGALGIAVMML